VAVVKKKTKTLYNWLQFSHLFPLASYPMWLVPKYITVIPMINDNDF